MRLEFVSCRDVHGFKWGNPGEKGKIAVTMKHPQLMPDGASGDQAVNP